MSALSLGYQVASKWGKMSEPIQISRLIQRIQRGEVRIPGFQRSFVWEPQQAALLMDSIYKGYPFGTILLWRTNTMLKTEKEVGGFKLPDPEKDYPIDYVLDGQQRITSIFATFQTDITDGSDDPEVWLPIYYDFMAKADAQDSQFVALKPEQVDSNRHFPLKTFLDPIAWSTASQKLPAEKYKEIVEVQQRFVGALIPIQTFATEDRASVAIVFERVNRLGVELDMFQLLTAWTWSEDFDLQEKFNSLADRFESFGFGDVGGDNDLLLRCCAAILRGDPSPTALIDVNGSDVRDKFAVVEKSLELAIDFLRKNLHVRHLKFLPYSALLIPLAAYFSIDQGKSVPGAHRKVLMRWFWRTSFSHRYSGNPMRNVKSDVGEAVKLRNKKASTLDTIPVKVTSDFFLSHTFNTKTVATKTMILLLAGLSPKSFISGQLVDLDEVLSEPNRKEYHHCFPKSFLNSSGLEKDQQAINSLVNYAFLYRAENREIKDKAPSVYRKMMPTSIKTIQNRALLPDVLFQDDWHAFRSERAQLLATAASKLI